MGFLSGAYGKLMAGKLVRDLQYQMTSVQSRLRRVTREIGQKEKMYQSQQRNMKQAMQAQMQYAAYGMMNKMGIDPNGLFNNPMSQSIDMNQMSIYSQCMQRAQMQYQSSMTMWENMFEMQRDADLQALKDLEEDLQTEKDNLESRIKIADQEYQAKKEEEKQGAQNLKPDYTGQG